MPTDSSSPLLVSVLVSPWSRRRSVRRCIPSRVRAPLSSTVSTESIAQRWTHPSNHPLCSPSVRIPSPAPLAGTSSDSIVLLGASPRPSRAPRVDVPATSSRPVRRSRLIVRARGMILSPVHPRLTARRTPRTRASSIHSWVRSMGSIKWVHRIHSHKHSCDNARIDFETIDRSIESMRA